MYTLVANLETGDRSHAAEQPPTEQDDDNDSDVSSSSCQLGNTNSKDCWILRKRNTCNRHRCEKVDFLTVRRDYCSFLCGEPSNTQLRSIDLHSSSSRREFLSSFSLFSFSFRLPSCYLILPYLFTLLLRFVSCNCSLFSRSLRLFLSCNFSPVFRPSYV